MAIKMNQSLKQTQNLAMTPQLQQAIKLLTLTHMEMTDVIAQEMVENPMLEESGGERSGDEAPGEQSLQSLEATADNFSGPEIVEGGKEEFDWEKYVDAYNSTSSSPRSASEFNGNDDQPDYENMVSQEIGRNIVNISDASQGNLVQADTVEKEASEITTRVNALGSLGQSFVAKF